MENIEFNHLYVGLSLILIIVLFLANYKNKQQASTDDIVNIVIGAYAVTTCLQILLFALGLIPFDQLQVVPTMLVGVFVILNRSFNHIKRAFIKKPNSS